MNHKGNKLCTSLHHFKRCNFDMMRKNCVNIPNDIFANIYEEMKTNDRKTWSDFQSFLTSKNCA